MAEKAWGHRVINRLYLPSYSFTLDSAQEMPNQMSLIHTFTQQTACFCPHELQCDYIG